MVRSRKALVAASVVCLAVVAAGCGSTGTAAGEDRERGFGAPEKGGKVEARSEVGKPGGAPPAPLPAPAPGAAGEKYALVIGVSSYADETIPRLSFASDDAAAVWGAFVEEPGIGCRPENARLLRDAEATRDAIKAGILWLNEKAGPADTVIVYFAGHGAIDVAADGSIGGNYLLPQDARAGPAASGRSPFDPATAISLAGIEERLKFNKAGHVLLVLDACFSGGAGKNFSQVRLDERQVERSEAELERLKDVGTGRAVVTACAPNQPALEADALGHGLFTYHFLRALRRDDNRDGVVTLGEAFDALAQGVRDEARRRGHAQTPELKENRSSAFALRVLPRSRFKVGLEARYGDSRPPLKAWPDVPARAEDVGPAKSYALFADARDTERPLSLIIFKVALTSNGARYERLLPSGENALALPATVAEGRGARFPEEGEDPAEPVPEEERNAHVLYVLAASDVEVAPAEVDRLERALLAGAAAAGPAGLPRKVAGIVEAEPSLKDAALLYLYVKQGAGAPALAETRHAVRDQEPPR